MVVQMNFMLWRKGQPYPFSGLLQETRKLSIYAIVLPRKSFCAFKDLTTGSVL